MSKLVPGHGPYNAPLLVIGEAPGKEEVLEGRPFVGASGWHLRRFIKAAGLDPESDCRYDNTIPYNLGTLPKSAGGLRKVVQDHWGHLDDTLARTTARAVLLVGRAALLRLTGKTGILREHGSVYMEHPDAARWDQIPMIATVHPAAVLRTKLESYWPLVERAVSRACDYARGMVFDRDAQRPPWEYVGARQLDAALATADIVALDTEFDERTSRPFLIGLTVNGHSVMSCRPTSDVVLVLKKHMLRRDLHKLMHHAPADITALLTLGIDTIPPVFDTMLAHSTCYSDLPVGLSSVTLFHLHHWLNWKDMQHDDPFYNAIDVIATWRVHGVQIGELHRLGLTEVYHREVLPAMAYTMAMEARGLQVDHDRSLALVSSARIEQRRLMSTVRQRAETIFEVRRAPLVAKSALLKAEIENIEGQGLKVGQQTLICINHDTYTGLAKKKFGACACPELYAHPWNVERRAVIAEKRKERASLEAKVKRWTPGSTMKRKRGGKTVDAPTGFDPGNNDHLRWLLYDKDALALPPQRKRDEHGSLTLTANADAVAKLLAHQAVRSRPDVVELLGAIKQYQHLDKMVSTFYQPRVDEHGVAHPELRIFGAGTGRPAGGPDSDLFDKRKSDYSYNVLNIPEEARSIYVPHDRLDIARLHVAYKEQLDDLEDDLGGGEPGDREGGELL